MIGLLVLLSLALVGNSNAEPRQWDAGGVSVRAAKLLDDYATAEREDGTTLVVWAQSRGAEPVVLGQLISAEGEVMWQEDGIVLAYGTRRAATPSAVAVGNEWVIVWLDADIAAGYTAERGWSGSGSMRMIRIDDNGNPVWEGGRGGFEFVPYSDQLDIRPYSVHASGDGVLVTWRVAFASWAQRVNADGELVWPEPVQIMNSYSYERTNLVTDNAGGVFIAWTNYNGGQYYLYANHLTVEGELAWHDTVGTLVRQANNGYFVYFGIVADGHDGAYVAWRNNDASTVVRAQNINAEGNLLWQTEGIVAADIGIGIDGLDIQASISNDVADGLLITVRGQNGVDPAVVIAQKISVGGSPAWTAEETVLCQSPDGYASFVNTRIVSDRAGGAICYYSRLSPEVTNQVDFLVARVGADGSRPWGAGCGVVAGSTPGYYALTAQPSFCGDAIQLTWLGKYYWIGQRELTTQRVALDDGEILYEEPIVLAAGESQGVRNLEAIALGNGATVVAWQEFASNREALRFQIMDVFGEPMFGPEGRPLAVDDESEPMRGESCTLCPDGSDGFFAIMRGLDERSWQRFRAVHLNGQGEFMSDPEGVPLLVDTTRFLDALDARAIPDGQGGCVLAAAAYNMEFYSVTAVMRIGSDCNPMWDEEVVYQDDARDVYPSGIMKSGDSNVIVVYAPTAFGDGLLRAAGIGLDGVEHWNTLLADQLAFYYFDDYAVCSDAADGCYAIWSSQDADVYYTYAQRVSPTGDLLWGDNGIEFVDSVSRQFDYSCGSDAVGNLTFAWTDYDGVDTDIRGQRISRAGTVMWPSDGLALSDAPNDQSWPQVAVISDNEVYVVWTDQRNVGGDNWFNDVYGTHVNARGQVRDDNYWQAGGSPICNYAYGQDNPVLIADGVGGATCVWYDSRSTAVWDNGVFAQRLYDPIFTDADEKPVVATEFALEQNYPNPFNPETVIEFALPNGSKTTLKVFDITGREVATLVDEQLTAGNHRVQFDGSRLASGVYFYSLRAENRALTRKMVMLK